MYLLLGPRADELCERLRLELALHQELARVHHVDESRLVDRDLKHHKG